MSAIIAIISYSHDSDEYKVRVLELANRLRAEGVDARIDQYEDSPPEGWPRWMDAWISKAHYVLVVCTETYRRRVEGEEEPGKGKGAKWEGALITQHLYDNDGRNDRFLPLVFGSDATRWIPTFLAGATYYDVSTETGYTNLYRRLTSQPAVIRPPLGSVRPLLPVSAPSSSSEVKSDKALTDHTEEFLQSLVLIEAPGGHLIVPAKSVARSGRVHLELLPQTTKEAAFLAQVRDARAPALGVAYGTDAVLGSVDEVMQRREGPQEVWTLILRPDERGLSPGNMEMAYNGYSADKLAELRARRILLDDPPPRPDEGPVSELKDMMLEVFIRRNGGPGEIKESPIPKVYAAYHMEPALFEAVAKLFVLLWMRVGAVVQHVQELDLWLEPGGRVNVHFVGQRHRVYVNREPTVIRVDGVLNVGVVREA